MEHDLYGHWFDPSIVHVIYRDIAREDRSEFGFFEFATFYLSIFLGGWSDYFTAEQNSVNFSLLFSIL